MTCASAPSRVAGGRSPERARPARGSPPREPRDRALAPRGRRACDRAGRLTEEGEPATQAAARGPAHRIIRPMPMPPRRITAMHLTTLVALAGVLLAAAVPAEAQDRARTKEVIVGFAAEPRSLLPNTIVDWTTNNQLEHMYDRLVDRDAKALQARPDARHRMEDRQRHHVGVHAAPGRQVPQRRALQCRVRQGHHGLHQGPGEQDALCAALGPGEGRPGGQRLHGALHHREALARIDRPHRRHRLPPHAAQGAQGAGRPGPRRQAHRHRAVQVRAVGARREARDGEEPRLLAGRPPI